MDACMYVPVILGACTQHQTLEYVARFCQLQCLWNHKWKKNRKRKEKKRKKGEQETLDYVARFCHLQRLCWGGWGGGAYHQWVHVHVSEWMCMWVSGCACERACTHARTHARKETRREGPAALPARVQKKKNTLRTSRQGPSQKKQVSSPKTEMGKNKLKPPRQVPCTRAPPRPELPRTWPGLLSVSVHIECVCWHWMCVLTWKNKLFTR